MKIKELIFYLFFLLLGGGQYFYASTSTSIDKSFSKYFQEKHIKQVDTDSFSSFIENTDLDLEEEFSAQNENKSEVKIKLIKYDFYKAIYFIKSSVFSFYFDSNNKIVSTLLYYSTRPLYISHRVLRI
jgi:hypothetical protein